MKLSENIYALNVWTDEKSYWGTLGVYESFLDAQSDGELVVSNIDKFVFYRIESVQLVKADQDTSSKISFKH